MAKDDKVEVVYEGYLAEILTIGLGTFKRGVPQKVSKEVAERLLSHPDFGFKEFHKKDEVPKPIDIEEEAKE